MKVTTVFADLSRIRHAIKPTMINQIFFLREIKVPVRILLNFMLSRKNQLKLVKVNLLSDLTVIEKVLFSIKIYPFSLVTL